MLPLRSLSVHDLRRAIPLAAIGIAALVPATASATVTATTVTSPSANSNIMPLNTDANPLIPLSELVTITGTAPGASDGDLVDVVCDTGNGVHLVLPIPVPVNNQKWTTADVAPFTLGLPISIGALDNAPGSGDRGRMCNVRAIPAGAEPLNRTPFAPTPVGIGRIDTFDGGGLSAGPLKNYQAVSNQAQGMYSITSAGDEGISDSRRHYGSNFAQRADGVFEEVASFGQDSMPLGVLGGGSFGRTNFGDSSIGISNPDGGNASAGLLPFDTAGPPDNAFGSTHVNVQRSVDAAGNATVKETSRLRQCHVSLVSCTGYDDANIELARTTVTGAAGITAVVSDTWKNMDTVAHRLDLRYYNRVGDGGNTGIGVGGGTPLQRSAHDTFVPSTAGQWSMVINSDTNDPDTDDSDDHGAITYVNAPDIVLMEDSDEFESWYQRVVPAGGSFTVTQILNQAGSVAEAQDLAGASERIVIAASKPPTAPATLTSDNEALKQALQSALTNLSAALGRARYTASGRIATSKVTHKRYIRLRVSGPAGSVRIKVAVLNRSGVKVGKAQKITVQTNRRLNIRSLTVPKSAKKVLITVL